MAAKKPDYIGQLAMVRTNLLTAQTDAREARIDLQTCRELNDELRKQLATAREEAETDKIKVRVLQDEIRREGRIVDALLDLSERI